MQLKSSEEQKIKKQQIREKGRQERLNLKIETFQHYPPYSEKPKCNICGYDGIHALTLGHMDGRGHEHRRLLSKSKSNRTRGGTPFYAALKKQGFPNTEYPMQVECANCQAEKTNNGGLQEYYDRKSSEVKDVSKSQV